MREYLDELQRRLSELFDPQIRRVRERIDPLIAQARARYQKLERRERLLVQIAGGLLAVFLVYNLVVSPLIDYINGLDEQIVSRERDLAGMQRLVATFTRVKDDLRAAQHDTVPAGRAFSLFSVLEASFSKTVGHDKIASITPQADKKLPDGLVQYGVQLKLSDVSLGQIVDALYAVRTLGVPVGVANLHIERRTPNTHSFDVDLTCVALGHSA